MRTATKHRNVRQYLENAIRSGEYRPGDQLPSEIDLAQQYGVSYMTARKAVAELVASDLLERRASKGTFVRSAAHARLATTTLNLIVEAYEGQSIKEFLMLGIRLARLRGWNSNVIRLGPEQQDQAVRVIRNGELAIVMISDIPENSSLWLAMRAARGKAISFHCDVSAADIVTIHSNPVADLQLAVDHLRQYGHEHIALMCQMPLPDQATSPVYWQREVPATANRVVPPLSLVPVCAPLFESPMRSCYNAVTRCLEDHPEITAFVTKSDELAMATLSACRDAGRPVPKTVSIVSQGNWHTMEFTDPPITCVDVNFAGQFDEAARVFDLALAGKDSGPMLRAVDSFLVERGSVGQAAR